MWKTHARHCQCSLKSCILLQRQWYGDVPVLLRVVVVVVAAVVVVVEV